MLEDALKSIEKSFLKIILEQNVDLTGHFPLYKVHGDVSEFKKVVLDTESYEKYSNLHRFIKSDLESILRKHHIVFFGYGMTDRRLLDWLRELGDDCRYLRLSYTVMTENDWNHIKEEDRKLLEKSNIKPVFVENYDHIPYLISNLVKNIVPPSLNLHFTISSAEDKWIIKSDAGPDREVDVPWRTDSNFAVSLMEFTNMADKPVTKDKERQELNASAVRLGDALGKALLAADDRKRINDAIGHETPLVTVKSDDDIILSLPWELVRMDNQFILREGRIDLVRSISALSNEPKELPPPDRYMSLVMNVSAPEGHRIGSLNFEDENYRILRALHEYTDITFTDLGTLDDMTDMICGGR